ncbi:hypothetical protein F6X38_09795 [Aureimonas leprariae]|uniref:Uncharacterized protein n=2 Tax=Plantimonas leprariae TaxID=2615207 RepID=A0A7V7TWX5_9HYPH|nr:hypothetical protein F6X38_09795 [Aureimonas leprariae]
MAAPANPRAEMVKSKPTVDSLTGLKHPVLYDDGKCPKGQIAQFSKKGGQGQMRRACVDKPN